MASLLSGALTAQDPPDPPESQDTRRRLEALEEELAAIRAELDAKEGEEEGAGPTLDIYGYGQVNFSYEIENEEGPASHTTSNAFAIGGLDLFLVSQLTDEISFLSEIFFEGTDEGDFDIDVERLVIKNRFNDNFDVQAGLMYTSLGYWNRVYNHGEYLQTSIDRPEIIEFEDQGGYLPIHTVGLRLHSWFDLGCGFLDGNVAIGNGRGPVPDDIQLIEDDNDNVSVNIHGAFEFAAVPGLSLGAGIYFDEIPPNTDPGDGPVHGDITERIPSAMVIYVADSWELLSEFYYIYQDPDDPAEPTTRSSGWYAQVAHRFDSWTPYVRVDATNIDDSNTYFENLDDTFTAAVGVRFDFARSNALTLQAASVHENAPPGDTGEHDYEFILQWAFAF